jgi:hypothetical protein
VVGATLAWGSYMYIYNEMKQGFLARDASAREKGKLSEYQIAIASLTGGMLCEFYSSESISLLSTTGLTTQFFTTPIWLVKTRLQLNQFNDPGALKNMTVYNGPRGRSSWIGFLFLFFHSFHSSPFSFSSLLLLLLLLLFLFLLFIFFFFFFFFFFTVSYLFYLPTISRLFIE